MSATHRVLTAVRADLREHLSRLTGWALRPLQGTRTHAAIAEVLGEAEEPSERPTMSSPAVLHAIESALGERRLRIRYTDGGGYHSEREVEPLAVHVTGRDLYLLAHCLKVDEPRTFKVARIERAEVLDQKVRARKVTLRGEFGHASRGFTGDPLDVAVRLAPSVAPLVEAHALAPDQRIEAQSDGSVVVRATVAGYLDTVRWVLGWGAAAEALTPPILRDTVRAELVGALGAYRPGIKRADARRPQSRRSSTA